MASIDHEGTFALGFAGVCFGVKSPAIEYSSVRGEKYPEADYVSKLADKRLNTNRSVKDLV